MSYLVPSYTLRITAATSATVIFLSGRTDTGYARAEPRHSPYSAGKPFDGASRL